MNVDFGEMFAPTVAVSSVRLLAALACELNLDLCNFDIEQAFVQSDLEEDVYMRLPQGCERLSGKIVRLTNSLYGLKQASRQWHAQLAKCLLTLGFVQCKADACVSFDGGECSDDHSTCRDIVAAGKRDRCDLFGRDLHQLVPAKNLVELRWYSGCCYERDWEKGVLTISQQTFAEQLVTEHGVEYSRSVRMPVGTRLTTFDEAPGNWPFRELVGSLMWLSTQTRPDISNAVRAVVRYCDAPKFIHWKAALGILRYVRRTSSFRITFQRGTVGGLKHAGVC